MQLRRHKEILALRQGLEAPTAFHASNLEVAEISEEIWNLMVPISPRSNPSIAASLPIEVEQREAFQALDSWSNEISTEVHSDPTVQKVNSLTINVTQICNLHCTYCAAGGDGSFGDPLKRISIEKTLPQISFFLNKLSAHSHFHISFLGGEPLLYPEALDMIARFTREEAAKKDITVSFKVTTNGTLINEKILNILDANKINVVVSLDGPAEINDRVRPQKNGQPVTGKIVENLKLLSEHKAQFGKLSVHGVFNKNNMEILKAYEFYQSLGVDFFEFTFAVDENSSELNQAFMSQMSAMAEQAWNQGGEGALRKISNFNHYFQLLDEQQRVENHCGLGKSLLIVDARNRLYSCPWKVGQASDLMGEGTDLHSEKFEAYKESLVVKNNCQSCWARFLCGGGCTYIHQTVGSQGKDTGFCERTRFLVSLSIFYYKKSRETHS